MWKKLKLEENTIYLFDSEPNIGNFLLKNQYNICCKASFWHVDLDCSKKKPGAMVESWTWGKTILVPVIEIFTNKDY